MERQNFERNTYHDNIIPSRIFICRIINKELVLKQGAAAQTKILNPAFDVTRKKKKKKKKTEKKGKKKAEQ